MFFNAILAIAAAAIHLYYTFQLMNSSDTTWYTWLMGVWALVEMDFGIIVACMPAAAEPFRSMGHSRWYTSFKGLTTWRRMTSDRQERSGHAMEDRKGIYGSHVSAQGKPRVKSYVLSGLDTMAQTDDSKLARNLRADGY